MAICWEALLKSDQQGRLRHNLTGEPSDTMRHASEFYGRRYGTSRKEAISEIPCRVENRNCPNSAATCYQ